MDLATSRVAPSSIRNLHATKITPTAIVLTWDPPAVGTTPFYYIVLYRHTGTPWWTVGALVLQTTTTLSNLTPGTTYDVEVMAYNS